MPDPAAILDAFALPSATRVDRRVPKTLLIENGAPTTADKRLIQEGIEEMRWIASLKPNSVGIAAWQREEGDYSEIALLAATFREKARIPRLVGLIHRAIPYPVVLLTLSDQGAALSLAHKRFSQAESGKSVLEDSIHTTPPLDADSNAPHLPAFLASLAIHRQNAGDLRQLYQAWIDRVSAFEAAVIVGSYRTDRDLAQSTVLREALGRREALEREISSLRKSAARERQINRRIELNLRIQSLESELAGLLSHF